MKDIHDCFRIKQIISPTDENKFFYFKVSHLVLCNFVFGYNPVSFLLNSNWIQINNKDCVEKSITKTSITLLFVWWSNSISSENSSIDIETSLF